MTTPSDPQSTLSLALLRYGVELDGRTVDYLWQTLSADLRRSVEHHGWHAQYPSRLLGLSELSEIVQPEGKVRITTHRLMATGSAHKGSPPLGATHEDCAAWPKERNRMPGGYPEQHVLHGCLAAPFEGSRL